MTEEFNIGERAAPGEFDVVVLGSGFGGTLLASILTQQGYRVAVIDRSAHPRFAIGESSTPAADLILRDLCQKYQLDELAPLTRYGSWKEAFPHVNCGRKRGFSYFHHSPGKLFQTDVENRNQLLVAASSDDLLCDMHWYRADVDQLFASNAQRRGVFIIEDATVRGIAHNDSDDSAWTIDYDVKKSVKKSVKKPVREQLRAGFVIDASGQAQMLLKHLEIADHTPILKTNSRAIYTHMKGVGAWCDAMGSLRCASHPFHCDAAAQHHLLDEGWLWLLRFDDGTTSVGLCIDGDIESNEFAPKEPVLSEAAEFARVIRRYPDLESLFRDATLAQQPGRWYRTGRLQRLRTQAAGDHWAALPHSVGFIDPLHSTGIALTMFAIEQIAAAFETQKTESQRREELNAYSDGLLATFTWIDELVWTCYQTRGDWDQFHAAVMLYFTAVVHYEQSRGQNQHPGHFLSADWKTLRDIGDRVVAQLADAKGSHLADGMIDQLASLTNVGLGDPSAQRMYRHTGCDV